MGVYQRGENWYVDFAFMKKRYRRRIGPSRKGADKVISKMKGEIAENRFLDVWKKPDPIKFKDFVEKYYLKNLEADRRRTSRLDILKREFGDKIIQEITAFQIERYKMNRKESLKPASVNRELALIKHVFSKAIEYGMLKENPAKKVKLLKGEVARVRFLSPDEMSSLIENCEERIRPLVVVSLNTGFRKSELLGLAWDRVDMDRGILTLLKTKGGKRRDVPMNETVRAVLEKIEGREGLVFLRKNGKPFKDSTLRKPFANALKKSGIQDFRWHDMRHCFASSLVMAGVDLNVVRELLGQADLKMTLRYSHLSPSAKTRAVSVLDSIMAQKPPQKTEEKKVVSLRP